MSIFRLRPWKQFNQRGLCLCPSLCIRLQSPRFVQILNNLSAILDKAEAHAGSRKIDPEILLNNRLAPDMLPFVRQIQIAADLAKGAAARLAGVEVPKHDDIEKTFSDLKARLAKTVAFVQSFKSTDIDGSEDREINLTLGEHTMSSSRASPI